MPVYELNQMHLANVLGLSVPERYSYLVKRFADWEQCYGLRSEAGWAAAGDDNGNEFIPIWPHERFAQLCMEVIGQIASQLSSLWTSGSRSYVPTCRRRGWGLPCFLFHKAAV